MGNYKCIVKLEQYTPMLHFQWREDGACLRASEVKPKLDRYVMKYLESKGIDRQKLPEGWSDYDPKTTTDHVALRYKMSFSADKVYEKADEGGKIHPLYFGAMGENRDNKIKAVWFTELSMTLVCLSENRIKMPDQDGEVTLMDVLKTMLPAFFATHCFGTRSNKGFGSFGVDQIDADKINEVQAAKLADLLPPDCERAFYMAYKQSLPDGNRMLDNVYVVSSLMKGGVNLPNQYKPADSIYFKSQLRQYSLRNYNDVGSEKAFIKSKVFSSFDQRRYKQYCINYASAGSDVQDARYEKYVFYRAFLGLTDNYSYRSFTPRGQRVGFSKKISVKPVDKNIERFPNPVVFKPDRNGILVMVYSVPEKLRTAKFKFGDCETEITPPEKFDLVAFVRECLNTYKDCNPAKKWKNWNEVKKAKIFGRRDSSYGTSMESFAEIIEIPKRKKGENKHG